MSNLSYIVRVYVSLAFIVAVLGYGVAMASSQVFVSQTLVLKVIQK